MFGPRLSSLFRSRWMALLWAALILWTAVDFVGVDHSGDSKDMAESGSLGTDITGRPIKTDDIAALQKVIDKP